MCSLPCVHICIVLLAHVLPDVQLCVILQLSLPGSTPNQLRQSEHLPGCLVCCHVFSNLLLCACSRVLCLPVCHLDVVCVRMLCVLAVCV